MADSGDTCVAVIDIGKTNVKVNAVTTDGHVLETLSSTNPVLPGPPWRHHDLDALRDWVFASIAALAARHRLDTIVCSGHGSGGVLVNEDPGDGSGAALPMIDYEQPLPPGLDQAYAPLSGSFFDRGSATMLGATHQARQLFWMQRAEPQTVAAARWFLGIPQYWAWLLTGNAVSESSFLGAQSHLWNVVEQRWAPIVTQLGWQRLMPPFAKAWETVGLLRPEIARRLGLAETARVLAGAHDSSLNFYRYQAAGLSDVAVVSTGTWIVGFSDRTPVARLDEHRGMTCNSDVCGKPLGGVLTMGGREFVAIAGADAPDGPVLRHAVERLIAQGTFALPSFGSDDGLFPGSAGRGTMFGPPPADAMERKALALIYCALLTTECLDALGDCRTVVLDGSFLRDPLYAALVAGLLPDRHVFFNRKGYGVASGAALLAEHAERTAPAPIDLDKPEPLTTLTSLLPTYSARWRSLIQNDRSLTPALTLR
ncbi:carbohydrate kinase [Metarhizobium album]|uniref:Carbohydrate kinase n=1 Tax=Metarhizobium album TaxID=2182425 RepID=A0A2U2DLN2_9HYPH|nr:FGGY family carbohydrate kinase [Rhizobium album]PWE54202.1 carbohydrate kinase [Rhizobium album]